MGDDRPNTYVEDDGTVIYRASSLGNCIKSLVASRLGMEPMPHPDWLLEKFEEGNTNEPVILKMLEDAGWGYSDGAQLEVEIPVGKGIKIRGHLDQIGFDGLADSPSDHVVEVKAFGKSFYEKFMKQGIMGFPYYVMQLAIYMAATGMPAAFVVGVKNDEGVVDRIGINFYELKDLGGIGAVKAKIARVEQWVKKGELPPCDYDQYPCQFYYLHEEEEKPEVVGEDLELDMLVTGYIVDRDLEKKHGLLKKEFGESILKLMRTRGVTAIDRGRYEVKTVSRANTSVDTLGLIEEVGRDVVNKHTKVTKSEYVTVTAKEKKGVVEDAE